MNIKSRFNLIPAFIALAGVLSIGIAFSFADAPPTSKPLYASNFAQAPEGEPDGEIVVLVKGVLIKTFEGKKVLEFPADPVDGYGVIFGPEGMNFLSVSARFNGTSKGRRNPEFGLGLADTGGYKLMLVPAAGQLQLLKGEEVKATIPFE